MNVIPEQVLDLRPVVGISGASTDSKSVIAMVAQVRANGAIPMVFANHGNRDPQADIAKVDSLIVMGNDYDIDPNTYIDGYAPGDPRESAHPKTRSEADNPEAAARAAYEEKLLTLAMERNLPTLAVCGGMHRVNVMRAGGLLQHIPDLVGNEHHEQNKDGIAPFSPVVPVEIEKHSMLGLIAGDLKSVYTPSYPPPAGSTFTYENSFHHQAIDPDRVGYGLRVTAWSDPYTNVYGEQRRLPEALEPVPGGPLGDWPLVGVQWHPEFGASQLSADIVGTFAAQASLYASTNPRDRSHDEMNAFAANIVSTGKNSRIPAQEAESFVARAMAAKTSAVPLRA